jgi:hypothetical protein
LASRVLANPTPPARLCTALPSAVHGCDRPVVPSLLNRIPGLCDLALI